MEANVGQTDIENGPTPQATGLGCCCRCHLTRRFSLQENGARTSTNTGSGSHHHSAYLVYQTGTRAKEAKFSDSFRGRTESRSRDRPPTGINAAKATKSSSLCQRLKGVCHENSRMLRFACHILILLTVVTCGGVIINSSSRNSNKLLHKPSHGSMEYLQHSGESHIITDLPFQSVSIEAFEKQLEKSENLTDLLRIFFDKDLSDLHINEIMQMKSYQPYGTHLERGMPDSGIMRDQEEEEEMLEAAWKHHQLMKHHPLGRCHHPRPQVLPVQPQYSEASERFFLPSCTLVHRCLNSSGCCPEGTVCSPKRITILEKPFLVFEKFSSRTVKPAKSRYVETLTFINHTECECRPSEREPTCPKECPTHFVQRAANGGCDCICHSSNVKCKRIQRGQHPLEEADLECIKAGDCLQPKCARGKFQVRTGFCPPLHHRRRKWKK